jgi:four helix bundle protein
MTERNDLKERTSKFGEDSIILCRSLKQDSVSRPVILQFVRSATSIGANYHEAQAAGSRKDFRYKIFICKKEVDETRYWLRMLKACYPERKDKIIILAEECRQLSNIFHASTIKLGQTDEGTK